MMDEEIQNSDESPIRPIIINEPYKLTFVGRVRKCQNVTCMEWSFILVSALNIGVSLGFAIFRMLTVDLQKQQSLHAFLILVHLGFSVYYLFHGIFQEQPFEILLFMLSSVIITMFLAINFAHLQTYIYYDFKLIRLVVISILLLPVLFLGTPVALEFWNSGRLIFKTVGGDMKLQRMCRVLFFVFTFIIFDVQLFLSALILYPQNGIFNLSPEEYFVFFVGLVFVVLWSGVGYFAVRLENQEMTWLFYFCSLVQPFFALYLFVRNYLIKHTTAASQVELLTLALLLVVHFTLLAVTSIASSNYGKGLKQSVYGMSTEVIRPENPIAESSGGNNEESQPLLGSR